MKFYGTTILGVRLSDGVAIGGDGQITFGDMVMKGKTQKVQKLYNDRVLAGFAGSAADSMTLLTRFEKKLGKSDWGRFLGLAVPLGLATLGVFALAQVLVRSAHSAQIRCPLCEHVFIIGSPIGAREEVFEVECPQCGGQMLVNLIPES